MVNPMCVASRSKVKSKIPRCNALTASLNCFMTTLWVAIKTAL